MDITNIETRTWEMMMAKFEAFAESVELLCQQHGDKSMQKWLDNQDVCQILGISKRTLQTYRDNGTLPFTQINHKMYYRPQDIEQVINNLKQK